LPAPPPAADAGAGAGPGGAAGAGDRGHRRLGATPSAGPAGHLPGQRSPSAHDRRDPLAPGPRSAHHRPDRGRGGGGDGGGRVIRIEEYLGELAFEELRKPWEALHAEAGATPFLSPIWLAAWPPAV